MIVERRIAIAVIKDGENFLFERRPPLNPKRKVGKLGCFGGGIEVMETPAQAVWREVIVEETDGLEDVAVDDFRELGEVRTRSRVGQPWAFHATVFELEVPEGIALKPKDDRELIQLDLAGVAIAKVRRSLKPSAEEAFSKFYGVK